MKHCTEQPGVREERQSFEAKSSPFQMRDLTKNPSLGLCGPPQLEE